MHSEAQSDIYHKIEQTEWEFHNDANHSEENKIILYTLPSMTAKLKWQLNKLYKPAFDKQMLKNINAEQFALLAKHQGVELPNSSEFVLQLMQEMQDETIDGLRDNWDKMVEFCLLCLDRQRILQDGRENLDKILDVTNWEHQRPELLERIIDQYSFRNN